MEISRDDYFIYRALRANTLLHHLSPFELVPDHTGRENVYGLVDGFLLCRMPDRFRQRELGAAACLWWCASQEATYIAGGGVRGACKGDKTSYCRNSGDYLILIC